MGQILVRYIGEIGIKGKNRSFFVKRLRHNIRDALKKNGLSGKVWSEGQRILVQADDESLPVALSAMQRVFGIASLSPTSRVPADLDRVIAEALALAQRAGLNTSSSFRVDARRADKSFPYTSPEINRLVGRAVQEATQARVDLSEQADLTIGIEVRDGGYDASDGVLLYGQVIPGPAGMPMNTQGRAFALLSGGIDSPVAAWLMMHRGCGVIPLHFAQSETEKQKALDNCQVLSQWAWGWEIKPLILDHHALMDPIADRLYQIGEGRWTCIFCKRAMIAKAAELAPRYRVQALVMGDSLGQVASQTMENLAAISWEAPLPVLRPLIAFDKQEIMALARRIGTYEISVKEATACAFVPANPLTRADPMHLQEIVGRLSQAAS